MKITFLGATQTVTGSKFLLEIENKKLLIDCGLFQGYKQLRLKNWAPLPINPHSIDAVILTHAHIDHSGYLPLLVKNGFSGPVYATGGTEDLCAILLPDSGHLQEEDARFANKFGFSKHHPALPLYTEADGRRAIKHFNRMVFNKTYRLFNSCDVQFHRAGHILGSSLVKITHEDTSIVFTGDIGRLNDTVMKPPQIIQSTDYLVIESTYGNRAHSDVSPQEQLAKVINQTAKRGGTILIPAFAVGRAQSLLYYIAQLKKENKIPNLPVFLDSPMAQDATDLLKHHLDELKISADQCKQLRQSATYINTREESKRIDNYRMPIIIISASGMATGGRVLHHLKAFAPEERNTILFTGFQAAGTRGARMVNGEKEIKIHGQMIPVRAQIELMSNTSAHADYNDILSWLENFNKPTRKVFIVHGEPEAAEALKEKIIEKFGWKCEVPDYLMQGDLS